MLTFPIDQFKNTENELLQSIIWASIFIEVSLETNLNYNAYNVYMLNAFGFLLS